MTPLNRQVLPLIQELEKRFEKLKTVLTGKSLESDSEGLTVGRWKHPELRIFIDESERNLAVADFTSILTEIRRLKTWTDR